MTRFELNGKSIEVDASPDTPVLWVLRDPIAPSAK
jgi:aerobic-type carbon monoxide dehydrogenase small subunit (CoxS/CutS family)